MSDVQDHEADDREDHTEVEARAREMGWRPKEEYRGPEGRWVDAAEFIRRGEEILPIVKKQNRTLEDRIAKQDVELREANTKLTEISKSMGEFVEYNRNAEQRGYKRAMKELRERQDVAVAHSDIEGFKKASEEIAELEASKPKAAEPPKSAPKAEPSPPAVDPYVSQWVAANPWFNENRKASAYAKSIDASLIEDEPDLGLRDRLAQVRKEVMTRFPELVRNPRRDDPSGVAGSAGEPTPRRKDKKSFENLPPEAKAACDRFVRDSKGKFTREEYAASYDWD